MEFGSYVSRYRNLENFGRDESKLTLNPDNDPKLALAIEEVINSYVTADIPLGVSYRQTPDGKFAIKLTAYKTPGHLDYLENVSGTLVGSLSRFRTR